jgi:hypothetical protein
MNDFNAEQARELLRKKREEKEKHKLDVLVPQEISFVLNEIQREINENTGSETKFAYALYDETVKELTNRGFNVDLYQDKTSVVSWE